MCQSDFCGFCGCSENKNGLDDRPHPGLLPRGEGEMFAASLKISATRLAGQFFAGRKSGGGLSSPWGEETGEGGRKKIDLCGRETLKEKLKPYLQTGEWSKLKWRCPN
jgi:hypothetical protein